MQSGLGNALMIQGQRYTNEQEQEEIAEKKFLEQASEKARRAAELQARIKDKMAGKAGLVSNFPILYARFLCQSFGLYQN